MGGEFLGTGWSFPVAIEDGAIATATGETDIEQAIRIVLGTAPGERVMRPEFGCRIHEATFAAVTPATLNRIETDVREALIAHEPRIDVESVDAARGDDPGTVLIDIDYRVRSTNSLENVVYPFYVTEGDG